MTERTRPRTIPEMFRDLAVMAEQSNDLEPVLSAISFVRTAVELEIERQRPGWSIDQMLGTKDAGAFRLPAGYSDMENKHG